MSNPTADYPAAIHTPIDIGAFGSEALGATSPDHANVHGKIEQEIVELQKKLGIGSSPASSASTGQVLTKQSNGTVIWATPSGGGGGTGDGAPVYIVAASDAPADWIAAADFTCDGTADDVQIQQAIDAARADGSAVALSPGTFAIAALLDLDGDDDPDLGPTIAVHGSGPAQTILVANLNVNIMRLKDCVRVDIQNLQFQVGGTGSGIISTEGTTTHRAFWMSTFKNLYFVGPWDNTHSGWAMNLGSPFRSTFENIEVGGTRNGVKLYSQNAAFNPGDCTFQRMFIEIAGGSGVAIHLNGAVSNATMNQVTFNMCEAICDGSASTTGILLDGVGMASWNTFTGINLEQFKTLINVDSGQGNRIECHYIEAEATSGVVFKCGTNSGHNFMSASFVYSASTQTLVNDGNTNAQPNYFWRTMVLDDTGSTLSITSSTSAVSQFLFNTRVGSGTMTAANLWMANNTKVTPRVVQATSGASITPNGDNGDMWINTAQAAALAINAPTGLLTQGQPVRFRLKDNGTARAITWNAIYRAVGVTLPTTTTINKTMYVEGYYNSTDTKVDITRVSIEA